MAAVLVFALLLPMIGQNDDLITGLTVQGLDPTGGLVRSPGTEDLPLDTLRTGQAFTLDFHLAQDARVIIIHVDPQGEVKEKGTALVGKTIVVTGTLENFTRQSIAQAISE